MEKQNNGNNTNKIKDFLIMPTFQRKNSINNNGDFNGTKADWKQIDRPSRLLETKPDFISESESAYWYFPNCVYRYSDHWGIVKNNIWTLNGKAESGSYKLGYVDRKDLKHITPKEFLNYSRTSGLEYRIDYDEIIKPSYLEHPEKNVYKETKYETDCDEKIKPYVLHPDGSEEWYNSKGDILCERLPGGLVAWYDENHKLTHAIFSSGMEQWYDSTGNVVQRKCINGEIIKFEYDQQGNLIRKESLNKIIEDTVENNQKNDNSNNNTMLTRSDNKKGVNGFNNKQEKQQRNYILWFFLGIIVAGLVYSIYKIIK